MKEENLYERLETHMHASSDEIKQVACIDNILTSFSINLNEWLNDELRYSALETFAAKTRYKSTDDEF